MAFIVAENFDILLKNNLELVKKTAAKYFVRGQENIMEDSIPLLCKDLSKLCKELDPNSLSKHIMNNEHPKPLPYQNFLDYSKQWIGNKKKTIINPIEEQLKTSIAQYEALLKILKTENKDTSNIEKLIELMNQQLKDLNKDNKQIADVTTAVEGKKKKDCEKFLSFIASSS